MPLLLLRQQMKEQEAPWLLEVLLKLMLLLLHPKSDLQIRGVSCSRGACVHAGGL